MASTLGAGVDPWLITPKERVRYEAQFRALQPINGIVTGDQAKGFLLQSQLPPQVLGQIWSLADMDADGKMNIDEFSIACKLINLKLRNFEMPKVLPPALLQSRSSAGTVITGNLLEGAPPIPPLPQISTAPVMMAPLGAPIIPPAAVPVLPVVGAPSPVPVIPGAGRIPQRPPPVSVPPVPAAPPTVERVLSLDSPLGAGSPLQEWAIPHPTKLKYTQVFNTMDRARSGFLSGPQARNIMVQTQLPQSILAQIWALADMDSDGRLSCEEFVVALHLCDMAKAGEMIPSVLPADMVPPTFRRQRQGSVPRGPQGLLMEAPDGKDAASSLPTVTFEDKRKENFEKGQAELERRRKSLLEIQRKEQEERERKDKEEQERREKTRVEQERRRQLELEKQLERQREAEQEREEQRRRLQEQKEAARREMERQRQLEWEKQRCHELQQQRQREQEKVLRLKAKNQNLSIELSQLNEKVKELSQKISETRIGVSGVKTTIDGMRTTRDTQLSEMSQLKSRLKEQNQRLVALSQEKARLETRNKLNMAADAANEEQVKLAFSNKQITLKQLKDRLQDFEHEISVKLDDIENNNGQLSDLKQQLNALILECEEMYKVYEERKTKVLEMKGVNVKTRGSRDFTTSSWGDAGWDTAPSSGWDDNTTAVTATGTEPDSNSDFMKYRALYEFVARNSDELSFQPGDIIMVPINQDAEPGWLAGAVRGSTGWFPQSYVELVDSPSRELAPVEGNTLDNMIPFPPDVVTIDQAKSQLEGIAEVPENVSENGSVAEITGEVGPEVPDRESPLLGKGQTVENIEAVAVYAWRARRPNDLSLKKGDKVIVKEQCDPWWYGEMGGTQGWFPKSYVKTMGAAGSNIQNLPLEEQEYYVALYPYQSQEAGDLIFQQGDVILVVKKEGDWWTGVIDDRQGIFPSNYVQKADTQVDVPQVPDLAVQPVLDEETPVTVVSIQHETKAEEAAHGGPDFSTDSATYQLKNKKPEIATVIAPYQASSAEQLTLQRGQLIMIRKKTKTGWWEGELQAKGRKRQLGWFPATYVKLLGAAKESGAVSQPAQEPVATASEPEKVVALYSYTALNDDELSFEKDDVITVVAREEAAWWRGELNGMSGLFPSNYVSALSDTLVLTAQEKKRQGCIQELIATEQAYIDDMTLVHEVFEKSLMKSAVLTGDEVRQIFVNWKEIIVCNHTFLRALRVRRDMSSGGIIRMVGDIICENMPRMSAYIRFCSCQLGAARFLQHLTETSPEFCDVVKVLQADVRTKGLPLSSFLIKPMQRITKYPLLIKKIIEFTDDNHPDWPHLQEALSMAQEFCAQVNEGVREKENSDCLEWLQQHVQCEGLQEQLVFNSLTNSLGSRKFLHYGILSKAKSGKQLVGFLMNDFLLLAQPSKPLESGTVFSFNKASNIRFKLYKKPLFLKELSIMDDSKVESSSVESSGNGESYYDEKKMMKLYDKENKIWYSLVSHTLTERNVWLKKLNEAVRTCAANASYQRQQQQTKDAQFGACGRVLVVVVEGFGLKANSVNGKCNAFCQVSMGCQEQHTPVIETVSDATWNASMQFLVKSLEEDVLCITVFDKGYFSPDDFLGRTEVRVADILKHIQYCHGPINKRLRLHEVDSGEIMLKLDIRLFNDNEDT